MAAGRLHRQLGSQDWVKREGGNIDVFSAILLLDVPLLLRPLKGLLGAYLREPTPGVLVTTERSLSIQRFTAAHELGHCLLKHELGSGPINFAFTVFGDDVPIIHGGTSYERSFLADAGATETH